jgi:hypothetical protein
MARELAFWNNLNGDEGVTLSNNHLPGKKIVSQEGIIGRNLELGNSIGGHWNQEFW